MTYSLQSPINIPILIKEITWSGYKSKRFMEILQMHFNCCQSHGDLDTFCAIWIEQKTWRNIYFHHHGSLQQICANLVTSFGRLLKAILLCPTLCGNVTVICTDISCCFHGVLGRGGNSFSILNNYTWTICYKRKHKIICWYFYTQNRSDTSLHK